MAEADPSRPSLGEGGDNSLVFTFFREIASFFQTRRINYAFPESVQEVCPYNERKAEEEKSRRIEAELTDWARSFAGPSSAEPRSEKPADFSNPVNRDTVAPHSSAAALAADRPTPPHNETSRSYSERLTPTSQHSTARPNAPSPKNPPRPEPAPTPRKICYTYQEALAETFRQCGLTDADLIGFKSEDIAVHNGDVNRKKSNGKPVKFGFRWADPSPKKSR